MTYFHFYPFPKRSLHSRHATNVLLICKFIHTYLFQIMSMVFHTNLNISTSSLCTTPGALSGAQDAWQGAAEAAECPGRSPFVPSSYLCEAAIRLAQLTQPRLFGEQLLILKHREPVSVPQGHKHHSFTTCTGVGTTKLIHSYYRLPRNSIPLCFNVLHGNKTLHFY